VSATNMLVLSINSSCVQSGTVAPRIDHVVPKIGGKRMITGEIILGAEVEVIVFFMVQNRVQSRDLREVDRPGRKPKVFVSIVGAVNFLMHIEHPFDTKV